jgi:hypothetical protein
MLSKVLFRTDLGTIDSSRLRREPVYLIQAQRHLHHAVNDVRSFKESAKGVATVDKMPFNYTYFILKNISKSMYFEYNDNFIHNSNMELLMSFY